MFLFFFFSSRRRHTRSLCDWSSDVCSSDLVAIAYSDPVKSDLAKCDVVFFATPNTVAMGEAKALLEARSEERRVGKECRSRWSRYDEKKKEKDSVRVGE